MLCSGRWHVRDPYLADLTGCTWHPFMRGYLQCVRLSDELLLKDAVRWLIFRQTLEK